MRPGKNDVPVRLLITGAELDELHRLTGALCETFGLDRRIEGYQGKRPIALFRWDLDALVDVVDHALRDAGDWENRRPKLRPGARRLEAEPLRLLLARLREARDEADRTAFGGVEPSSGTERGPAWQRAEP